MSQQSITLLTLTATASGSVAEARFVTFAGAQAGADTNTLGVNRYAATNGQLIAVDTLGTTVVEAGAAITAGAALETDADGRAIPQSNGPTVARALQTASGAGDRIEILLLPN